jgi:hypothetical protein
MNLLDRLEELDNKVPEDLCDVREDNAVLYKIEFKPSYRAGFNDCYTAVVTRERQLIKALRIAMDKLDSIGGADCDLNDKWFGGDISQCGCGPCSAR